MFAFLLGPAAVGWQPAEPAAGRAPRASGLSIAFHTPRLNVSGDYTPELAGDIQSWLRQRDAFIASMAKKYAALRPRLPIEYRLDADFVTAARTRNSVQVVDDCGDRVLCGVATRELPYAWDLADVRTLFNIPTEKAVALLGSYEGQDIDQLAADIKRAGVEGSNDERVITAVAASRLRQPGNLATRQPGNLSQATGNRSAASRSRSSTALKTTSSPMARATRSADSTPPATTRSRSSRSAGSEGATGRRSRASISIPRARRTSRSSLARHARTRRVCG